MPRAPGKQNVNKHFHRDPQSKLKSYMLSLTEYVWKSQNNALWDTLYHDLFCRFTEKDSYLSWWSVRKLYAIPVRLVWSSLTNALGSVSIFLTFCGVVSPLTTASVVSSPIASRSLANCAVWFWLKYWSVRLVASVTSQAGKIVRDKRQCTLNYFKAVSYTLWVL